MASLSRRLETIAGLVPIGSRVCDVGTDHGLLPIYLMQSHRAKSVTATDIRILPLEKARENIRKSGASGIRTVLSDGLDCAPDDTDTVVIAGLGGEVITGILDRGRSMVQKPGVLLLLQPTTSPEILRQYLCVNGFSIQTEHPLTENGKIYSVMQVVYTGEKQEMPDGYYYIGKIDPALPEGKAYAEKQLHRCSGCIKSLKSISRERTKCRYYEEIFDYISSLTEKNNGI